jgi:hypothetical protein
MEERAYASIDPEHEGAPPVAPLRQRGPRRPWWQRRPVQLLTAGAAVAAVAIGAWLVGRGSSAPVAAAASSPSPSLSQIGVNGTLTIPFLGTDLFAPNAKDTAVDASTDPRIGDPCIALGGYSDISQGIAVTVGGQTGQTLGVGSLQAGEVKGDPGKPASCQFYFSVYVPAGQSVYTVTISHRGTQTFTPDQVAQGIALTLGN